MLCFTATLTIKTLSLLYKPGLAVLVAIALASICNTAVSFREVGSWVRSLVSLLMRVIPVSSGCPLVMVPVLSTTKVFTRCSFSSDSAFLSKMPTGQFIDPLEVGVLCAYLCSDAAKSITGAAIPIDGGWSAE